MKALEVSQSVPKKKLGQIPKQFVLHQENECQQILAQKCSSESLLPYNSYL